MSPTTPTDLVALLAAQRAKLFGALIWSRCSRNANRNCGTPRLSAGLLADHEPPCVSLYQPKHRHHPDNQQDPMRYRNLLAEMEDFLRQKYPTREVRTLLEKFQALARDDSFWNHRTGWPFLVRPTASSGISSCNAPSRNCSSWPTAFTRSHCSVSSSRPTVTRFSL